jgi:hypothetical protein
MGIKENRAAIEREGGYVHACVCMCVCARVCVCVSEREREREWQLDSS